MKLIQVRDLFRLLAHRAAATRSHGHQLYSQAQLLSAEPLAAGVQLTILLPAYALNPSTDVSIQRTALCTIMDAATSVSAWMSHPRQLVSMSAGMDFSFLGDVQGDKEVLIKATCLGVQGKLAHTLAEAQQGDQVLATMKHSVFYMDLTLKEVFKLTD